MEILESCNDSVIIHNILEAFDLWELPKEEIYNAISTKHEFKLLPCVRKLQCDVNSTIPRIKKWTEYEITDFSEDDWLSIKDPDLYREIAITLHVYGAWGEPMIESLLKSKNPFKLYGIDEDINSFLLAMMDTDTKRIWGY